MAYLKYSDVTDSIAQIIAAIEDEPELSKRTELLNNFIRSVSVQLVNPLAQLCFERRAQGEPSDVIAIDLGLSQRAVLRLIRKRAVDLGVKSPLDRIEIIDYFDIRDHVSL